MLKNIVVVLLIAISFMAKADNFVTEGNGLRYVVAAQVDGESTLYVSEIDGALAAYRLTGEKLWEVKSKGKALMFEIIASDIDGDGDDELLAASADGNIYCYSSDGKLRWKFNPGHKVRFSEVAVLNQDGRVSIFAGGNDQKLYEIDIDGRSISTTDIKGVVRKIEVGNFIDIDKQSIFLHTYKHDKYRWNFLGFIDPDTKRVQKSIPFNDKRMKSLAKAMITDEQVADLDGDGKDDILFFGTVKEIIFKAFNGNFDQIASYQSKKMMQRYSHVQGTVLSPVSNEVVLQYGGFMLVLDREGKVLHQSGERYRGIIYNDLTLIPETSQLIGGAQIGGGNGLYFYDLTEKNWWSKEQKLQGRLLDVESNINKLYQQTLNFKVPSYQTVSDKEFVMITSIESKEEVQKLNGGNIVFVEQSLMHENTSRDYLVSKIGKSALKRDKRGKYIYSQDDVVNKAKEFEAAGQPFALWAGHGNDPFYLRIETMEKVLEVAPNCCYGFVYAEMSNVEDPRIIYYVKEYIPRLAKACRKNGKAKLYFRYKNVFWAATSHLEPWKQMFFSGKYSDILVPSSEDTSSRTQDLNLAGRVGMLRAGYVDDFAMRLVDDNPTSWRPLSPGGQRSVSPYLRQGVMMAAYGARYGIIFPNKYIEEPGMDAMFALMKSGVIPVVESKDILSISSWHLLDDPDEKLLTLIEDHHNSLLYSDKDEDAILSCAQMNWAGASVPDHDFSKAALGVDYRWTNYVPELPNGMVPIVPADYAAELKRKGVPYTVSNGTDGFVDGAKIPAKEFGKYIREAAEKGAKMMPVNVKGAAWSAIRIDETHIRVILMDQGYLDPADRTAKVTFNGEAPTTVVDILSGKTLKSKGELFKIKVPAGSIRVIDLTY